MYLIGQYKFFIIGGVVYYYLLYISWIEKYKIDTNFSFT